MLTIAIDVLCCGEVGMGILAITITFQAEVDLGCRSKSDAFIFWLYRLMDGAIGF